MPGSPPSDLSPYRARLRALDSVGSTMDEAKAWAAQGAPSGGVVWAREQTASRGRWGRPWHSPRGGLWFSYLWRIMGRLPQNAWELAPLMAGVAVADALDRVAGVRTQLKWPNDLLLDGKKVGGVLVESATAGAAPAFAVFGVGLNVNVGPEALPAEVRATATTLLAATGRQHSLESLLAACIASLDNGVAWLASNPALVLAAYKSRCATLGSRVSAEVPGRTLVGDAVDVAADGALLVQTAEGLARVTVGECRHLA